MPTAHHGRRTLPLRRRIAFGGVALALVLALAEVVVRLVWRRPVDEIGTELVDAGLFLRDAELGWRLAPNLEIQHRLHWGATVNVSTNSLGHRDREPDPALAARPRVLVLGDSFAFGFGIEDDETLAARLREHLPEAEVRNLGVTGYNVAQAHALLREQDLARRATVVVHAFCMNDVEVQSIPTHRARRQRVPRTGFKYLLSEHCHSYDLLRRAIGANKTVSRFLISLGLKEPLAGYEGLDENLRPFLIEEPPILQEAWASTLAELDAMHATCRAARAHLVVAAMPCLQVAEPQALVSSLAYVEFEPEDLDLAKAYRVLETHSRSRGIDYVAPPREVMALGGAAFLPNDMHLNAGATELVARALAPPIRRLLVR
jgi:lysophospholipase L1-like esterase